MSANQGVVSGLFGVPPETYGSEYKSHVLEQYKLYVEMSDRISERRQAANTYFLTVNTAIVAVLGLLANRADGLVNSIFLVSVGISGMVLSYSWYRLIVSYRQLNSGKFHVILAIERQLPLRLYDAEWTAIGQGKDPRLYRPFTTIETAVPFIFFAIYVVLSLFSLLLILLCP